MLCFQLVINKKQRIKIESYYTSLSASGFNPNRGKQSIYIEAKPKDSSGCMSTKLSKQCVCYCIFVLLNLIFCCTLIRIFILPVKFTP